MTRGKGIPGQANAVPLTKRHDGTPNAMIAHFVTPPPAPSPTGEALCGLCAENGRTCCATDPDLTYLSFPLSSPEWRRLLPYAALATCAPAGDADAFAREEEEANLAAAAPPPSAPGEKALTDGAQTAEGPPPGGDGIAAPEPNHPDFVLSMHFLFPGRRERVAALFPPEGTHYSLRTRKDGSCVFLGSSGCRVPRNSRPLYCLLFPIWVSSGSFTLFLSPDCLISQKARGPAQGIALLGQHPAKIRELHARLCRDWGLTSPEEKTGASPAADRHSP